MSDVRQRLEMANIIAFYAPYICGRRSSRYCVDDVRWKAASDKLSPARVARLTALQAAMGPNGGSDRTA